MIFLADKMVSVSYLFVNRDHDDMQIQAKGNNYSETIWAASKTSIKGFSIRVHVGNLPRKQNLHVRKPRESSAKGECQGQAAKTAAKSDDLKSRSSYSCTNIQMAIYIYEYLRIFSAKAAAKDIAKQMPLRKPKLCARKNRESRCESF